MKFADRTRTLRLEFCSEASKVGHGLAALVSSQCTPRTGPSFKITRTTLLSTETWCISKLRHVWFDANQTRASSLRLRQRLLALHEVGSEHRLSPWSSAVRSICGQNCSLYTELVGDVAIKLISHIAVVGDPVRCCREPERD